MRTLAACPERFPHVPRMSLRDPTRGVRVPLLHDGVTGSLAIVRDWLSSLITGRLPELALALGLGYAAWNLADGIAEAAVHVIAQHVGPSIG